MCLLPSFYVSGQLLNNPLAENLTENNQTNNSKIYENSISTAGVIVAAIITATGSAFVLLHQRKDQQKDLLKLEYSQQKNRLELEYDISLREKRTKAYEKLWELLWVQSPKEHPKYYTEEKLKKWEKDLRDWYYTDGNGMLLSERNQKLYHNFLDTFLHDYIEGLKEKKTPDFLGEKEVTQLKNFASGFRTSLTMDIGGREDPKISYSYGNLKIIKPGNWTIDASCSAEQQFEVLYMGTKKINLADGSAYMIVKNIDNWKHIDLINTDNKPPILEPNKSLTFTWKYGVGKEIEEIFKDHNSKDLGTLLDLIYILVRIEINTKSETLSVVNTYEFRVIKCSNCKSVCLPESSYCTSCGAALDHVNRIQKI